MAKLKIDQPASYVAPQRAARPEMRPMSRELDDEHPAWPFPIKGLQSSDDATQDAKKPAAGDGGRNSDRAG